MSFYKKYLKYKEKYLELKKIKQFGGNMIWTGHEYPRIWRYIASSSDGTKLVAVVKGLNGGKIYTSNNSGVTWREREQNRDWMAVASSSDGTKLVAVVEGFRGGKIYTSDDSGVTWTEREQNRKWTSVASSSDGTKLVAVVSKGKIYTSDDSGVTWTARDQPRNWKSVASSSDGTKLVAVVNDGKIFTSTNSGVTWSTHGEQNRDWIAVASSSDGTKLVAVVIKGNIYTSNDSGVTWTEREQVRKWLSVASSSDGTKLVAVVLGGKIYTSDDSGETWTECEQNRNWESVASSSDGTKLVAVASNDKIYTSNNLVPVGPAPAVEKERIIRETNAAILTDTSTPDNINLSDTGYDVMGISNDTIQNFITNNPNKSVIIKMIDSATSSRCFLYNIDDLNQILKSNIVYPCLKANNYPNQESNVITDLPLYSLAVVINVRVLIKKEILNSFLNPLLENPNNLFIVINRHVYSYPSIASHTLLFEGGSYVGGLHCNSGSEPEKLYSVKRVNI